jgi:hypothetical protein
MIKEYCNKWGILPECLHIVECKEGNEHYTYAGGNIVQAKEGDYILVTDDLFTFSVKKVTDVFTNKQVMETILNENSDIYPISQNVTNAVNYTIRLVDRVAEDERLNAILKEKLSVTLAQVDEALKEFKHDNLG